MNYLLSNLFRDRVLWAILGLSAVAALNIMDIVSTVFGAGFFHFWVVKITVASAATGAIIFGIFLALREKKDRQLALLLPGFIEERRAFLEGKASADPEFQTFCHQCSHFDLLRLGCLLVLRERKVRIRLNDETQITHCLYWNLDDRHPVMLLTRRTKEKKEDAWSRMEGAGHREETEMKGK